MKYKSTLSSKGQVTLPKKLRDSIGLERGDTLYIQVQEDSSLVLKKPKFSSLDEVFEAVSGVDYVDSSKRAKIRDQRVRARYSPGPVASKGVEEETDHLDTSEGVKPC